MSQCTDTCTSWLLLGEVMSLCLNVLRHTSYNQYVLNPDLWSSMILHRKHIASIFLKGVTAGLEVKNWVQVGLHVSHLSVHYLQSDQLQKYQRTPSTTSEDSIRFHSSGSLDLDSKETAERPNEVIIKSSLKNYSPKRTNQVCLLQFSRPQYESYNNYNNSPFSGCTAGGALILCSDQRTFPPHWIQEDEQKL